MRARMAWVSFLLMASWAGAQGSAGSVELTPTAGYWFGDTIVSGTSETLDFDVTIDDAPGFGLKLGYRFSPNWALEAYLSRVQADLTTGEDELFGGEEKIGEMELSTAELGVEGSFGHSRLVPFLAGGVGAMRLEPDLPGTSGDTQFVANIGAGFKIFMTPQLALRFDARWHSVNLDEDGTNDDCDWWDDWDCHRDEWITFTELSVGLSFVF